MTENFGRNQTAFLLALLAAATIAVSLMWINHGGPDNLVGSDAVVVTGTSAEAGFPADGGATPGTSATGGGAGTQGPGDVPGVSQ